MQEKQCAQLSILCKLKFIGMNSKTQLKFISLTYEVYWSTVESWSSSLTNPKEEALERVQEGFPESSTRSLGPVYVDYQSALSVLELEKKCLKSQRHSALLPVVLVVHDHQLRNFELFNVNHDRTEIYRKSAIPYTYWWQFNSL